MNVNDPRNGIGPEKVQSEYVAKLFKERLGAVSTEVYLRDPELVWIVSSHLQKHAQGEIAALERRMEIEPTERPGTEQIRLAITNIALDGFAGSELWTLEMAAYAHRAGIPTLVYSPHLGRVARKFAQHGFPITDDLVELKAFSPNILHVHHQAETSAARQAVGPDCRTVNMIHGLLPVPEWPGAGMDLYMAVSLHAKAKTVLVGSPAWDDILLMPNFFDPRRFGKRKARQRGNALLHSSRITPACVEQMRLIVQPHGLELDQIGYGGAVTTKPETILPRYDVVFAAGRSAIEAMASGCRVILWDHGIVGPLITAANFWYALATNFSLASGVLPFVMPDDPALETWVSQQISTPDDSAEVRALVHRYLSVDTLGARMVAIYADLLSAPRRGRRVSRPKKDVSKQRQARIDVAGQ